MRQGPVARLVDCLGFGIQKGWKSPRREGCSPVEAHVAVFQVEAPCLVAVLVALPAGSPVNFRMDYHPALIQTAPTPWPPFTSHAHDYTFSFCLSANSSTIATLRTTECLVYYFVSDLILRLFQRRSLSFLHDKERPLVSARFVNSEFVAGN